MAIRIRELQANGFAALKTKLEAVLINITDLTSWDVDIERGEGNLLKAFLQQVFTAISAVTFVGGGLNDMTAGGTYTGSEDARYLVTVDGTGIPDTYKWAKDGVEQATGVSMVGGAVALSDGITITFAATTAHTATNSWQFDVMIP